MTGDERAVLAQADRHQGGTHAAQAGIAGGHREHCAVGLRHRHLDVALADTSFRHARAEMGDQGIDRQTCGNLATRMPAHAVRHDGDAERLVAEDAVFVARPDLPDISFHRHPPATHLPPPDHGPARDTTPGQAAQTHIIA